MEEYKIKSGSYDCRNSSFRDLHLEHIFYGNKVFCLICQHAICELESFSENAVNDHIFSVAHFSRMKTLFKRFLEDDPKSNDFNSKYLDIVNNSVLHVPVVMKQPCYIFEQDNSVFCAICSFDICNLTEADAYLLDHLLSLSHAHNITKMEQWVYFFNDNNAKLVFKKDSVHCSDCDLIFILNDNNYMQFAADHIECKHNYARFEDLGTLKDKSENNQQSVPPLRLIDIDPDEEVRILSEIKTDEMDLKPLMIQNQDFLKIAIGRNKYYVCMCCKKYILKLTNRLCVLVAHLEGKKHRVSVKSGVKECKDFLNKLALKDIENPSITDVYDDDLNIFEVFKLLKMKRATIKLNFQFIKEKEGAFWCIPCMVLVPFNKGGELLLSHCWGTEHNNVLNEKFARYCAQFAENENPCKITTPERQKELESNLALIRERSEKPLLKMNTELIRIKDNNYTCLLCNVPIAFDVSHNSHVIEEHYFSRIHSKRLYVEFCNGDGHEFDIFIEPKSSLGDI